jgi:hypothetical protein
MKPAVAAPVQVSEPRSGPPPIPPARRFFNRKNQAKENEQ